MEVRTGKGGKGSAKSYRGSGGARRRELMMSVEEGTCTTSLRLESFLWLLICDIVYASKDIEGAKTANRGI
jgi:hypothetical protein